MSLWFAGKRVALARKLPEQGGGPAIEAGVTGTITSLIEPFTSLFHPRSGGGSVWAEVNCMVRWDDGYLGFQHTDQLEPLIPDSEASIYTVEELLDHMEETWVDGDLLTELESDRPYAPA